MDQKQIAEQMIDFNKMVFNKTSQTLVLLQDQTENLVFYLMNKGKKVMSEWLNTYKKGLESLCL